MGRLLRCISPYYMTGRAPVQAKWSLLFNS